jgi:hypothetical protein
MEANIETVLAAVKRGEYQSQISIQKLLYLNSLARSLVLRSFRGLRKQEEVLHAVEHVGMFNRFAMNGVNLTHLGALPEEEKRARYQVVRQSLMELITFFIQQKTSLPAQMEASAYQHQGLWA